MLATLVRERSGSPEHGSTAAGSLLGNSVRDDSEQTLFHSLLHPRTHWLLGEHVVRGGQAVIPGTGFLELARAALAYRFEDRSIEIRDLVFLQPFAVGADETRALNIRLNRQGDHSLVAYGDSEEQPYATARVAYVDTPAGPKQSVSMIRARCRERGEVRDGRLVQHFMDFGPRWANVQAIHLGQSEALIDLVLPASFTSDLATYALHPAMLDMATGAAQRLIPGFAGNDDFYVPFSYGRVLVRQPVPATFSSHVRLRAAEGKSAIFDVTLLDEEGNELVSIERFIMRRVEAFAAVPNSSKPTLRPDGPETAEEGFLREGMTNAEGLEALDRILACNVSPQVVASTLDLDLWLDRLEHGGRGTPAEDANWSIGTPGLARPVGDTGLKAPRDEIERELAAIWKEMLGLQQVSIDDDFFELGGQSLIAMRLFNRIRKEHGVELPLSVLFQAPTIAATAALLRETKGMPAIAPSADGVEVSMQACADDPSAAEHTPATADHEAGESPAVGASSPSFSTAPRSLVEITRGGNRPPLFCVHGAGGNVLNFRDLSFGLHHDQPFFALQARGVDGVSRPHGSIEEMARAYIEEIRALRPRGPYLLAGYSGGGVVAFEMAQQLKALGEEVPLLVFFDTYHPQMPIRTVTFGRKLMLLRKEGLAYLKERALDRVERVRAVRERIQIKLCVLRGRPVPHALRDRHLTESFGRTSKRYRPQQWQGKAILFRAETVPFVFGGGGPYYGWDSVVLGGVKTVMIPGNHDTLLLGANAKVLMGPLNAALDQANLRMTSRPKLAEEPV
jgi:thioesterase domain-containing protein/acyl carrier protein